MDSPYRLTYTVHNSVPDSISYAGYIPSAGTLGRGGHEASTVPWSLFESDAADAIIRAAIDSLHSLSR
jgi:hypothetical protein